MVLDIRGIEESSVYQEIFAKGKAEGRAEGRLEQAREILLRQGSKELGRPGKKVQKAVAAMTDLERLHILQDRVLDATSWDEVLGSTESVS
jgi:predicted transposase YdaD